MRAALALAVLSLASACIPSEGPMMSPFENCLGCHGSGGEGPAWSVAGTWTKGASVTIIDAAGKSVTVRGNKAGNFYTAEPLVFPLRVSVDGITMPDPNVTTNPRPPARLEEGGCNRCHRAAALKFGPLMAPHQDCLSCHVAGGEAYRHPFSAAGTFKAGDQISVGGLSTTANSVGNFFFYSATDPLAPPQPASVNGKAMGTNPPYLGCNRCHATGTPSGDFGPNMAPHQDCLTCHTVGGPGVPFSAAGTFRPGDVVTFLPSGVSTPCNSVGNFFFYASITPLTPPKDVRVGGETMQAAPYFGCNRCHGSGNPGD